MGLFSFLKDAGSNIMGNNEAGDAAAKEQALLDNLRSLNLNIENENIQLDGDKVTISGSADSQAIKEKAILAIGNVAGVGSVDAYIVVESPEPEAKFYEVKSGDSLSKIAKEFYGDPMKYTAIFEANQPMLEDPNKIFPGQTLRIPPIQ